MYYPSHKLREVQKLKSSTLNQVATMFQLMSPHHPTLNQLNVLLKDQLSAEIAVIGCL